MKLPNRKGFTLIEVIVVAGIIAVLAGILVPLIFKEIDESKITRASADVKSISSALFVFRKDTGQWPVSASCEPTITLLHGSGTLPAFAAATWDQSSFNSLNFYLNTDDNGCWPTTWKGPYMATVSPDPWGYAYVIDAKEFMTNGATWLLSAGPNGNVETGIADAAPVGDDIGVRIK